MCGEVVPENTTLTRRRIRVTVTKDMMTAMMVISEPEPGEPPVTEDEISEALTQADVVYGIDKDFLNELIEKPEYGKPIKVARGDPAEKGKDSQLTYLFETDHQKTPNETPDGHIDYREMNFIQNVEKDALLARRTPPEPGTNAMGVDGRELVAPRGRNIPFKYGDNTRLSEDELELYAASAGAIVFAQGKVSVKEVMLIRGDVDFNVGNIDCVGSVKVTGKICNGFKLRVGGDLEVDGSVEDADISVEGNILVRGGFFGEGSGVMHADGDVVVKFAEGQKITSGGHVISGGELLNCHVTAHENVIVKGRCGKLIGGEINAGHEIRASVIGTDAGTATMLTVAYDADMMRQYQEAVHEINRLEADEERVKESLISLYRLQMDGRLTPDQEAGLSKLEAFHKGVPQALKGLKAKKEALAERMSEICDARIVAEKAIHPGVSAHIGILTLDLHEETGPSELVHDGSRVIITDWDVRKGK